MDKEKHVTTACHGGGNKFPWGLCYNYISSSIINIGIRRKKVRKENKERTYKVMFCKQSSGAYTPRVTIPDSMLRDLNIRPGDYVQYTRVEDGILIRKRV